MEMQILENGNLKITIDNSDDREMIADSLENSFHKDHGVIEDMLENTGWTPNGRLYSVLPESIGALTDAPILSDEVSFNDDGSQDVIGRVWWYPNYQVESFAEKLLENGFVVFDKAPESA
jgi:hypothetical protein